MHTNHTSNFRNFIKKAMPEFTDTEQRLMDLYEKILPVAESLFGPKVPEKPVFKVYTHDNNPMMIPCTEHGIPGIKIALNKACENDEYRLKYQLSHEAAHSLWPTGDTFTNGLDEGTAVYFSLHYLSLHPSTRDYRNRVIECMQRGADASYFEVYEIVNRLLCQHPNVIREIRSVNDYIGTVTKVELTDLNLGLSEKEVDLLTSQFIYEL